MHATNAIQMAGVTYRQFDYWTKNNLLPGVKSEGSGVPRTLTIPQVQHLTLMGELVSGGINPEKASRYATAILADGWVALGPNLMIGSKGGEWKP